MAKNMKSTDARSWEDCSTLIRFLLDDGLIQADAEHYGRYNIRWFAWMANRDNSLLVVSIDDQGLEKACREGHVIQADAAKHGVACGIGGVSPTGGSVLLSVYTPPAWPIITDDGFSERRVETVWPDDDTLLSHIDRLLRM